MSMGNDFSLAAPLLGSIQAGFLLQQYCKVHGIHDALCKSAWAIRLVVPLTCEHARRLAILPCAFAQICPGYAWVCPCCSLA